MKNLMFIILSLLSSKVLAGDLRCVSTARSSDSHVLLQGTATRGQILSVNYLNQGNVRQIELLVEKINPSENHVDIQGIARNMVFIGGGQMSFRLILPLNALEAARLKTVSPVFNSEEQIDEVELACDVENLYQTLPVAF